MKWVDENPTFRKYWQSGRNCGICEIKEANLTA
jgi:hypothetical protein